MAIRSGARAPHFQLTGSDGRQHGLIEEPSPITVLLFYVGDDTPTCTRQLTEYNDAFVELDRVGVRLLGIAPQGEESHYAFTCRLDLKFPLLVDADRSVGRDYGVVLPFGLYRRSTFVIDENGMIRYAHRAGFGGYLKASPAKKAVEVALRLVSEAGNTTSSS